MAVDGDGVGAGDEAAMRRLATDALLFALILSIGLTLLGLATIEPLFRLLGAEAAVMPDIRAYMTLWYPGVGFLVGSMCVMGPRSSVQAKRKTESVGSTPQQTRFLPCALASYMDWSATLMNRLRRSFGLDPDGTRSSRSEATPRLAVTVPAASRTPV